MICNTRDFGQVDYSAEDIVTFCQPIFGFEEYRSFLLIFDEDGVGKHMAWLQSIDNPSVCFILIDPTPFSGFFSPTLPAGIEDDLGDGEYVCWVVCTFRGQWSDSTVNLKSPILINTQARRAAQIILEQDYPVRFAFAKGDN